jgi:hypothetical protein
MFYNAQDNTPATLHTITYWYKSKVNATAVVGKGSGMVVKGGRVDVSQSSRVINGLLKITPAGSMVQFADGHQMASIPVVALYHDASGNQITPNADCMLDIDISIDLAIMVKFGNVVKMVISDGEYTTGKTQLPGAGGWNTTYTTPRGRMISAQIGESSAGLRGKKWYPNYDEIDTTKPVMTITHNDNNAPDFSRVIPDVKDYTTTISINADLLMALAKMVADGNGKPVKLRVKDAQSPLIAEINTGDSTDNKPSTATYLVMPMMVR